MSFRFAAFVVLMGVLIEAAAQEVDVRTQFFPRYEEKPATIPDADHLWVFVLAGQSNMAGRGQVEQQDTIANPRILTVNKNGQLILAKEPLHFYEPNLTGLDCGLAFARTLIKHIPENVSILLLPTAVGGSSISQWLGDSLHRDVHLMTNFREKVAIGKGYGDIKGILWHQGESDAHPESIPKYQDRLATLFKTFRQIVGNDKLIIMAGELGSYSANPDNWKRINNEIHTYADDHAMVGVVATGDLHHKGDGIHFNSDGQRKIGERFAATYLALSKSKN